MDIRIQWETRACPDEGCPLPPSEEEYIVNGTTVYWSDPLAWPNQTLPKEGEDAWIAGGLDMVLDISPPRLNALYIRGGLRFKTDEPELILSANTIVILGGVLQVTNFFDEIYNSVLDW